MPPVIDKEKCIACNVCAEICSMDVFGPVRKGEIPEPIYWKDCWHCRACVMDCPQNAITLRYPLPTMLLTNRADCDDSQDRKVRTWSL